MAIRISGLRVPVDGDDGAMLGLIARACGVRTADVQHWRILRKSLDLRDKARLRFVVNVEAAVSADLEPQILREREHSTAPRIEPFSDPPFVLPDRGSQSLRFRPVVVGSGPGGLFAALILAEAGYAPIVLERGTPVHERIRDVAAFDGGGAFEPESNYLFGEGGAGTFSDGKLTCRMSGPDVQRVLELLAECKGQQIGKPSILYYHRPHLGSNRLPAVVKALRRRIEAAGGEIRFHTRMEDLTIRDGALAEIGTSGGAVPADCVVLATGHSARDVYRMLRVRGVPMVPKAFQMGLRIEHTQELVNRVQYGSVRHEDHLGNADYSLVGHGSADAFTFCMCAGGYVIPSVSDVGYFCTNGMSLSHRDSPYANSGLVVTLPVEQFGSTDVLAGMAIQEKIERRAFEIGRGEYACPTQRAADYVDRIAGTATSVPKSSYPRAGVAASLDEVLHPYVADAIRTALPKMDRAWRGRYVRDAVLVGPEARGSSPVRIVRDDLTRESPGVAGLFPVGEGAGYAGGIVSAAVDGLRTAKAILAKYAPLRR